MMRSCFAIFRTSSRFFLEQPLYRALVCSGDFEDIAVLEPELYRTVCSSAPPYTWQMKLTRGEIAAGLRNLDGDCFPLQGQRMHFNREESAEKKLASAL
jgi:hypothetical protein